MTDGIIIGIGSTVGALILVALAALVARQWRSPKRIDRLERVVPILTRGVWALLGLHVQEHNGDVAPEITDAYSDLTKIVTNGVVSQKGGNK